MNRFLFIISMVLFLGAISCSNDMQLGSSVNSYATDMTNGDQNDLSKDDSLVSDYVGVSKTFKFMELADVNISSDLTHNTSTKKEKMEYDTPTRPSFLTKKQVTGQVVQDKFKQGKEGFVTEDIGVAVQTKSRDLDILVVVDDSGSMGDEQKYLSENLPDLISEINSTNWRVAVIHTGLETSSSYAAAASCLVGVIKKEDYKGLEPEIALDRASADFKNIVTSLGTSGDANEQGILKAVYGLKQDVFCSSNQNYANWLRSKNEAFLAVLIVSDEDNCSNGNASSCKARIQKHSSYKNHMDAIDFDSYYNDTVANGEKGIKFFEDFLTSIGRTPNVDARVFALVGTNGKTYKNLVDATGGKYGSIVPNPATDPEPGYTGTLHMISSDLAGTVFNDTFDLKETPSPDAEFKMFIDSDMSPVDSSKYKVEGKKVTILDNNLFTSDNKDVRFTYSYGSTRFNEVLLSKKPVENTIKVIVNGRTLYKNSGDWNIVKTDAGYKILLAEYPAQDADIEVSYEEDIDLNTTFTFKLDRSNGKKLVNFRVLVDDSEVNSNDYTQENDYGTIKFKSGKVPKAGSEVKLEFIAKTPKLSYNIPAEEAKFVSLKDKDGNEVIFKKENNQFVIDLESFKENQELYYTYEDLSVAKGKIHIDHDILPGTLKLDGTSIDKFNKNGNVLSLDNSILKNKRNLNVSYTYVKETRNKFVLPELDLNYIYTWSVLVNGKQVGYTEYSINGKTIEFTDEFMKKTFNDDVRLDHLNDTVTISAYREQQ